MLSAAEQSRGVPCETTAVRDPQGISSLSARDAGDRARRPRWPAPRSALDAARPGAGVRGGWERTSSA